MKIRLCINKPDIEDYINRTYEDDIIFPDCTFNQLKKDLQKGSECDLLIISDLALKENLKENLNMLTDTFEQKFRIIFLFIDNNGSTDFSNYTISPDISNLLVTKAIYDFNTSLPLESDILKSLIDNPKHRKDVLSFLKDSSEVRYEIKEIEKEIVIDRIVNVNSNAVISFVGIQGTGITTSALYFSVRLADTLIEVGNTSKVLIVDLNKYNPKLRHYFDLSDPNKSISYIASLIANRNTKIDSLNALEYAFKPFKRNNLYFIDGTFDIIDKNIIGDYELKYMFDHFRKIFSYIIFTTNGDLYNPFTKFAFNNSTHSFVSTDMNLANLRKLKIMLNYNKMENTFLIINKYFEVKKYTPAEFADTLDFNSYFQLPFLPKIIDASNRKSKLIDDDFYINPIDKMVSIFVKKPQINKKISLLTKMKKGVKNVFSR